MWPGQQQPPGGEQNPQDAQQNPYQQQPGQPNPYNQQQPGFGEQQPGYGYPQAGYQTPPPVQPWAQTPQQPAAPQGGGTSPYATKTVAIVAAAAVVVAAAATGAFVLTRDDKKVVEAGGDKPAAASSAPAASSAAPAAPSGNPRAGGEAKPVIPGWKVVINPKYGTAFDVPPEWNVASSGMSTGFEDEKKNDGSPFVMMSAPAFLKQDWCKVDSDKNGSEETTSLAGSGTKGAQGAKDTAEASTNAAETWVYAAYAQSVKNPREIVKTTPAKEYTTTSGLKGHIATATASPIPKENKCSSDGKSIAFSFRNAKGDFATWVLYGAAGVEGEVKQETYEKILSSVRLSE